MKDPTGPGRYLVYAYDSGDVQQTEPSKCGEFDDRGEAERRAMDAVVIDGRWLSCVIRTRDARMVALYDTEEMS